MVFVSLDPAASSTADWFRRCLDICVVDLNVVTMKIRVARVRIKHSSNRILTPHKTHLACHPLSKPRPPPRPPILAFPYPCLDSSCPRTRSDQLILQAARLGRKTTISDHTPPKSHWTVLERATVEERDPDTPQSKDWMPEGPTLSLLKCPRQERAVQSVSSDRQSRYQLFQD